MRMLKFPNEDHLYYWTKGLAARGDMLEIEVDMIKKMIEPKKETVVSQEEVVEEAPKKKAGRPKKVDDK